MARTNLITVLFESLLSSGPTGTVATVPRMSLRPICLPRRKKWFLCFRLTHLPTSCGTRLWLVCLVSYRQGNRNVTDNLTSLFLYKVWGLLNMRPGNSILCIVFCDRVWGTD
uniref:Putative secreted protein n=1 Tax=Ixodes ricinus TaxID=34613 RepID=A0A6B0UJN3_IXORI